MTKSLFLRVRATPLLLYVGLVTVLVFAGSCFDRSRESSPEGKRRLISETGEANIAVTVVQSVCFNEAPSPYLEQFVDALPIIPRINVSDGKQHVLKAYNFSQKLHRDLPPTTLYGFGTSLSKARVPGPALLATRNVPTYIRWENCISDDKHFLPLDDTLSRANPPRGGVPIVPHLHGMESQSRYDGHPEAWFTKHGDTGPKYETQDYIYPNTVMPAMLWYHDHTIGMTRVNVVAGLAGPYIVHGEAHEKPKGLPQGRREIILMLQDRQFYENGSINFPSVAFDTSTHPNWCPGYYGDTILVNGKVWPYLDVLPLRYRLRILNAASDRYFSLSLDNVNTSFIKIGSDGGYLQTPVILDSMTLSPGERVDCIVDFGGLTNGTRVVLNNSAPTPFPRGPPGGPAFDPASGLSAVLQFRVGATSSGDHSKVPAILAENVTFLSRADRIRVRRFTLSEAINNVGNGTELLLANLTWNDPPTEFVPSRSTEVWEFIGLTPGLDHPIHVHLVKFQVQSVQLINITRYIENNCSVEMSYGHADSCFLNASRGPSPDEIGWKDTVSASSGAVTRIVIRFTSYDGSCFTFDPTLEPGYLWHCHLLSHEDNAMMRPLIITRRDSDLHHTDGWNASAPVAG